jgi:hypothetical protein
VVLEDDEPDARSRVVGVYCMYCIVCLHSQLFADVPGWEDLKNIPGLGHEMLGELRL